MRKVIALLICLSFLFIMTSCGGGGGGGSNGDTGGGDVGANITPSAGTWLDSNLSFSINDDGTEINDFEVTYSGHADGAICNFDYEESIGIGSIPIENGSFSYNAGGYEILGTFSDENTCDIEFVWSLIDTTCNANYSGTINFLAEYMNEVISIPFADISIDGSFDDWDSVPAMFIDTAGDVHDTPNADIQTAYIAKDDQFIYLRVDVASDFEDGTFIGFRLEPSNLEFALHYSSDNQSTVLREWDYSWDDPINLMSYPNSFAVVNGNKVEFKISIGDLTKSIDYNYCDLEVWDNPDGVQDTTEKVLVDFSLEVSNNFRSSSDNLEVSVDETQGIYLLGGMPPYHVKSISSIAASVDLTDNVLTVTGDAPGTAQIIVSDTNNDSLTIDVTVISTLVCEQHEFGASNIQYFIYSDGESWDFTALNTMNVSALRIQSRLGGSGGYDFSIQIKLNDTIIEEWTQPVTSLYTNYIHDAVVDISLNAGDKITYHISGGTLGTPGGAITGPNYIRLCE